MIHRFAGHDGLDLAYRELGEGRPLLLLHGFTADATQWIHTGLAATLAERGHRVILPDLRGHGASARPHDPARYPPDVPAEDGLALVEHLGLDDYDLGGYSLGGQVVLRMLVRGARPARAIVGGQGLRTINPEPGQESRYRTTLTAMIDGTTLGPGSPEADQAYWITRLGADPQALIHVLDAQVATPETELAKITTPVLVATGEQDRRGAAELAAVLPNARLARVPGDHFTALTSPEFADAVLEFLSGRWR